MRIITLLENETQRSELKAARGLSMYIETMKHKILFDLGPNDAYLQNAKYMGIDIKDIDTLVVSHGHNDHGSGLSKFLSLNQKATVYVSPYIFEEHVKTKGSDMVYIGVRQPKHDIDRFVFVEDDLKIDAELTIVANVPSKTIPIPDKRLKVYDGYRYLDDPFHHEIYMLVTETDNTCLFTGCSHRGIEHIIDSIETTHAIQCTHVIGGYHLSQYDSFDIQQVEYLNHLAHKWSNRTNTTFFSCHCTGEDAFRQLKHQMRDKIIRLQTGDTIIL